MKPTLKILLFIALTTLTACNKSTPITEVEGFDYGRVRNDKYTNTFFNIEMNVPKGWSIQDDTQRKEIMKQGGEEVFKDDDKMKKVLKASEITTANLFMAFAKKPGTNIEYNSNILLLAENIEQYPALKSGDKYLENAAKLLHNSKMDIVQIDNSFPKRTINGINFYEMNVVVHVEQTDVRQTYLSTVDKGFAICLIYGYETDSQKAEIEKYINTFASLKR